MKRSRRRVEVVLDVYSVPPPMLCHLGDDSDESKRLQQRINIADELAVLVEVARVDLRVNDVNVTQMLEDTLQRLVLYALNVEVQRVDSTNRYVVLVNQRVDARRGDLERMVNKDLWMLTSDRSKLQHRRALAVVCVVKRPFVPVAIGHHCLVNVNVRPSALDLIDFCLLSFKPVDIVL